MIKTSCYSLPPSTSMGRLMVLRLNELCLSILLLTSLTVPVVVAVLPTIAAVPAAAAAAATTSTPWFSGAIGPFTNGLYASAVGTFTLHGIYAIKREQQEIAERKAESDRRERKAKDKERALREAKEARDQRALQGVHMDRVEQSTAAVRQHTAEVQRMTSANPNGMFGPAPSTLVNDPLLSRVPRG